MRVKICGITDAVALKAAVEGGADAVGFVVGVPQSPRNLSTRRAATLIGQTPIFVDKVLVTTEKRASILQEISRTLKPSAIQIHGAAVSDFKVLRKSLRGAELIGSVHNGVRNPLQTALGLRNYVKAILSDTYTPLRRGGSGLTNDWRLVSRIRNHILPTPLLLAGGLNPMNVATAIRLVRPYGVDVSSGVESRPSVKDPTLIHKFIRNAKGVAY